MYNKGHKISLQLLGVVLGIMMPFFVFALPTSATSDECAFNSSFSRRVKNTCDYMEQWPVQNITKDQIQVVAQFSTNVYSGKSGLAKNIMNVAEKDDKTKELVKEQISTGWTQGATLTRNYFIVSLFASSREKNYLAILDRNTFDLIKLLKEPSKTAWGHIHSIWNNAGVDDRIRVDANHSLGSASDRVDLCYDIERLVRGRDKLIINAAGEDIPCSDDVVPAYRSNSTNNEYGLAYQGDAIYKNGSKEYNYTLLWDAGEPSWLIENEYKKGIKTRCSSEDSAGCIYQHESEGMHRKRHHKAIAIKDASDGKIVKYLFISKSVLDGEPESISFDHNGNLYLTVIKKNSRNIPIIKVVKILKGIHTPSYVSEELGNWFSVNVETMASAGIKVADEVLSGEGADAILPCDTNRLTENEHLSCVKNIYESIKKAVQKGDPSIIPSIRANTTRKIFNEAVAKFKKSKYIKAILSNIKTTKIAAQTIESFKEETIFKVFQEMLSDSSNPSNIKRVVKYFNKVSPDFAKKMAESLKNAGVFDVIKNHSWTDKDRLKLVGVNYTNTVVLATNFNAPTIVLAKSSKKSAKEEEKNETDAEDMDDSSVTDNDINTNVSIETDDDAEANFIDKSSWQDAAAEVNDGDEDFEMPADISLDGDSDNDGDDDDDEESGIPNTSCDPDIEGDCEVYHGGLSQDNSSSKAQDICSATGVPDVVKRSSGCEDLGDKSLDNSFANIINAVMGILGIVAVGGIVFGGVQYMTANGDANKIKSAKTAIIYCVVGLGIVILSAAIVNWIIGIV